MTISTQRESLLHLRVQLCVLSALLLLLPALIFAQQVEEAEASPMEEPEAAEEIEEKKELQRITVTGYHIKRIDAEGPAPVVVYDRDMLDQSGVNTLKDFARYLTLNARVPNESRSQVSSITGADYINLRGIGADSSG